MQSSKGRRDGRGPLGLVTAITPMMTERGLADPAAGGSVLAQFDGVLAAAAPELAGHARAVVFDADTGRLDVAPTPRRPGVRNEAALQRVGADRGGQGEGARRECPRPARPAVRARKGRPRHGGRRPGPAADRAPPRRCIDGPRRTATAAPSKPTAKPHRHAE
ncbi:hypothetical protein [Streptomyces sp. x-80]|uniref:hypothetical protein n=1 Tax=Streptomyces sp. x-80 TaxID=2789282 RepID=UPI00397F5CF0